MAWPQARRADGVASLFAILAVAVVLLAGHTSAAVLGVDVGTQYFKAVLVKPGNPFDIVLTKDSRRKEAATIAFKPSTSGAQAAHPFPERLYGADASALAPRYPSDVYPNLKPLLGNLSDIQFNVDLYKTRFPAVQVVQDEKTQTVSIKSSSVPGAEFSIEELVSMQLKNIKSNAEAMAGKGHLTEDVVITVPAFYTAEERLAVQSAAELAGLNVLALITDGLAVGLDFAMSRSFPSVDKGEAPEYHMIFDMGAGSTTSTILRFQARTIKDIGRLNKTIQEVTVLGTNWDRTLGGDLLNGLIMDDMVTKFAASKAAKAANVDEAAVRKHGRTMAKLWREVEKVRLTLSANQNTQASFEALYEDVDFKYKITRQEFEGLAAAYASRIQAPIDGALAAAKLTWKDLNSVVLHGGAVRTPFVQKKLETLADDASKLRSNVNADEAAVMGAAYKAAGFSPSFRVKKEIKSFDSANYGASISWAAGDKERRQAIFTSTSVVGTTKQVPLNKVEDFDLKITQTVPTANGQDDRAIFNVKATNVTASVNELIKSFGCNKEEIKTQLSVRLSPLTTLPEVVGGTVSCDSDQATKKNVVDGVKNLFGFGGKKEQKPLKEGEDEHDGLRDDAKADSSISSASESVTASAKAAIKGKRDDKTDDEPKKVTHTINLALSTTQIGGKQYDANALEKIKNRLSEFDLSDAGRRTREDFYNRLEAYTYRARDLLTDATFISASTKPQREAIEQLLSTTSEWLSSEGATATLAIIKQKLKALEDLVNPIKFRVEEASKRPEALQQLQTALNSTESVIGIIKGTIDRAAASASSIAEAAAAAATEPVAAGTDEDDLEEKDASAAAPKPSPTPEPALYSDADLSDISSVYETVKEWLAEQLETQSGLTASDVPAFTVAELVQRAELLSNANLRLLGKSPPKPKTTKPKASKSKKPKTAKTKSSANTAADTEATPATDETAPVPEAEDAPAPETAGKEEDIHDEL